MSSHPLITTLKNLSGNARGVVFTEPLWGIPYNLYAPYASIYMLAFGLNDRQIGLIASINLGFQIVASLLSGMATDKLGRRRATLLFDLLAWSVPTLIWAVAQNFTYFLVAAIFNSAWRFSMTSWSCLVVEDTDPELLVDLYSWIYISGLLAAFFTPLAGLFIQWFSLVPTMRGLYVLAFVMMTAKFVTMNRMVTETAHGQARMRESAEKSLLALLGEYRGVLGVLLRSPVTLYTAGLMVVLGISSTVINTFWGVIATERIQIPAGHLALYPFARAVVQLLFFFLVIPRISRLRFRAPMLVGFAGMVLSHLLLVLTPEKGYLLLVASVALEAGSLATLNPFMDRRIALSVEPNERARIMALLYVLVLAVTAPFGWIAGELSSLNRALPFVLTISLYALGGMLVWLSGRRRVESAVIEVVGES